VKAANCTLIRATRAIRMATLGVTMVHCRVPRAETGAGIELWVLFCVNLIYSFIAPELSDNIIT
jgi:hypothetical protein